MVDNTVNCGCCHQSKLNGDDDPRLKCRDCNHYICSSCYGYFIDLTDMLCCICFDDEEFIDAQ